MITRVTRQACENTLSIRHSHLVISADIQQHGETLLRLDPSAGCVERQLSHWNAHPVTSQVAQAQDPLSVRHHDGLEGDAWVSAVERMTSWSLACAGLFRRTFMLSTGQELSMVAM